MEKTPLWDVESFWFTPPQVNDGNTSSISYRSWSHFVDCKPYRNMKPYFITSWAWNKNALQIIFMQPLRAGTSLTYIEFPVKREDEPSIREWLKKHMHPSWKI